MRSFTNLNELIGRVPFSVVRKLSTIDIGRGSEALYRDQLPGLLTNLASRARIESITASSAIEGVTVPDAGRAQRIINRQVASLHTRSEQELAGYRDAQDYLFQQSWQPLNAGLVLHLHRLLFAHTQAPGGQFKAEDNLVVDRNAQGLATVRFRPVPARQTPSYVDELIQRYQNAVDAEQHHPVLLVGLFVLDLLIVHPFSDGNGRVARVLTNGLLLEAGYTVGRFVSMESAIEASADEYYAALLASTRGWHQDSADPWPWLEYFVAIMAGAYDIFADRAASQIGVATLSKQQRVEDYVLRHGPSSFNIAEVRAALPGISDKTIRIVFEQLKQRGVLQAEGAGRSAAWLRSL
jgi:Fic family protein